MKMAKAKCDSAFIRLSDADFELFIADGAELHAPKPAWGVHPRVGIPVGMRTKCPECGRENVLVLTVCYGGSGLKEGEWSWSFRLRPH
jgi:hypothetical protein